MRNALMSLRSALQKPIFERRHAHAPTNGSIRIRSGATTLPELLMPDGVDRRWTQMVQVGDSYLTTLELRGLPSTA